MRCFLLSQNSRKSSKEKLPGVYFAISSLEAIAYDTPVYTMVTDIIYVFYTEKRRKKSSLEII